MKIINLTPHAININSLAVEPSGMVARMARYLGGEYECNIGVIVRQLFSALKEECKPGVLEEYTKNFGYDATVE